MKVLLVIIAILGCCGVCSAQTPTPTPTRIEFSASGGIQSTWFRDPTTPLTDTRRFAGVNAMARLMWHPDHLLSVGLMSGYTSFSKESFTADEIPVLREPFSLSLDAVPLQVALSMQSGGFEVGIGLGGYLLSSRVTGATDVRQANTIFEIGFSTNVSYVFSIVDGLSVGPEVNMHLLSNRGIFALSPCLRIKWDVVRY